MTQIIRAAKSGFCFGVRQAIEKTEEQIVKNKDGEISIDKNEKKEGRGAYICNNIECLDKVIKSKRLEKVLETKISSEIYESLRGVILDK